jgi:hypothetical protein
MDIIPLQKAICGKSSSACAVCSRVRYKNAISVLKQHWRESNDALAIICNSVQHQHVAAVVVFWAYVPSSQNSAVLSLQLNVIECAAKLKAHCVFYFISVTQWTPL